MSYHELKALVIMKWNRNRSEMKWNRGVYLSFKKVDPGKLSDVTKNANAVIRHIETDDVTQTKKPAMAAALWVAKKLA